jgi:two-component system, sensor histidine kinase
VSSARASLIRKAFGRDRYRPAPAAPVGRLEASGGYGPNTTEPARLLLVEDEPLHRRMVRMVLASPTISVAEVETGEAAINFLSMRPVDLVLLDVSLPRMTGPEVLAWLRNGHAQWRDIPVMALVAGEDERWLGPMRALGLDDWTPKPIDRTDMMTRILRMLPGLPTQAGA